MDYKTLAFLFAILCFFGSSSCQNRHKNICGHENCIRNLRLVSSSTPNPDKIVFTMHADEDLKRLLLSGNWDSISFSGGIFDSIKYGDRKINPVQTENSNEFIIGLPAFRFFKYSQNQMDSIASITYENVEIKIFSKDETWRLKPCDKSCIDK